MNTFSLTRSRAVISEHHFFPRSLFSRLPSNMHSIQQIEHSKRKGSNIFIFAFSHRLTRLLYSKQTYNI